MKVASANFHARRPAGRTRGVVGLITVIILGAMVLAVGLAASFAAQTELLIAADVDHGQYARQLASTCLEEALFRLKKDDSYAGGTIPVTASADCQVTVSGSGTSRTLTATASDGPNSKALQVQAERRSNVAASARTWYLQSWLEVDP